MPYYLKSQPNKDGTRLIYYQLNYSGFVCIISMDIAVHPDLFKGGRIKKGHPDAVRLNRILEVREKLIRDTHLDLLVDGIPRPGTLKAEVMRRLGIDRDKIDSVYQFAIKFADTKGDGTGEQFRNVATQINEFKPGLKWSDVNDAIIDGFKAHLVRKKAYSPETSSKYLQRFKAILRAGNRAGVNKYYGFENDGVKIEKKTSTKIFLDESELDIIHKTIMPEPLDKYRDLLLVLCYTGVRYSDVTKISRLSFTKHEDTGYFTIIDEKEDSRAQIPAHPIVIAILQKYNWQLPELSHQNANDYMKEVGRVAGLTREIVETTFKGEKRIDKIVKRYELIGTHIGRRSLVCNLRLAGWSLDDIMPITGHRSHSSIKRYDRLLPGNHLAIAFKSEFFKKNKLKSLQ